MNAYFVSRMTFDGPANGGDSGLSLRVKSVVTSPVLGERRLTCSLRNLNKKKLDFGFIGHQLLAELPR